MCTYNLLHIHTIFYMCRQYYKVFSEVIDDVIPMRLKYDVIHIGLCESSETLYRRSSSAEA